MKAETFDIVSNYGFGEDKEQGLPEWTDGKIAQTSVYPGNRCSYADHQAQESSSP
jgi:hypothetical protein